MTAVLVAQWAIGFGVGYVQGMCDPLHHMNDNSIFEILSTEVQISAGIGLIDGSITSAFIWYARSHELKGFRRNTLENQLNFKALNFDDTEEVFSNERLSSFAPCDYDEDEERVSLVNFHDNRPTQRNSTENGIPLSTYNNLDLKSDSDEDDEYDMTFVNIKA